MNQQMQKLPQPETNMLQLPQQPLPPYSSPSRPEDNSQAPLYEYSFAQGKNRWHQWWTEERLVFLTMGLGNLFLFILIVWWFL